MKKFFKARPKSRNGAMRSRILRVVPIYNLSVQYWSRYSPIPIFSGHVNLVYTIHGKVIIMSLQNMKLVYEINRITYPSPLSCWRICAGGRVLSWLQCQTNSSITLQLPDISRHFILKNYTMTYDFKVLKLKEFGMWQKGRSLEWKEISGESWDR